MDFLFTSPIVPWVIGGVLLYFGWNTLAPRLRVSGFSAEALRARMLGDGYAADKVDKGAAREKKAGNFLAAGRLYEESGQLMPAVDVYLEGEEFMAAAFALEKIPGKADKAAEMFLKAGDYKKAAEVWSANGKAERAAPLFEERGNNLEAARLWALAGKWEKAAALFVKSGYPVRAAEAYEKQGDFIRAAESYEKHFMENVTLSTSYSGGAPSSEMRHAFKAGQLYDKAGASDKAREIYLRGSFFKEAAGVEAKVGHFGRAAEYYLRAEDLASAAEAFEKGGDAVKAANYRGEVAFRAGRLAEAAAAFRKGQDYQRSAELFEQIGMLREAGGAYEDANSFAAAGGVYTRAGLKENAAACYEKAGDYETAAGFFEQLGHGARAAELYEKAGHTFKSGITAAASGQTKKAIGLLQRVPPSDENYLEATERLAELFVATGNNSLAIERLQRALEGKSVSAESLGLHYWLAVAQEAGPGAPDAVRTYKRILSENYDFKDVVARLAAVESGRPLPPPELPPPPTPAPPPPQAPAAAATAAAAPAAKPAAPGPQAPATRFVLQEEIARGPLGVVHKGEDTTTRAAVAIRILPGSVPLPHGTVADLKAALAVAHPTLLRVLALIDVNGQKAVVTEFAQGPTLATILRERGKLNGGQTQAIGIALAHALATLHGRGLVHGAIEPANLMLVARALKVADLGLGRLQASLAPASPYRAPGGGYDAAGDVYAMGAVLHHLLAGAPPKPGAPAAGLPAPFDALVPRCLDARPESRPRAEELVAALSPKP
jgi:tetratricopeptide (TPR) repeat protein